MRWHLVTDSPRIFSVDNSSVKGMDFSDVLTPDVWFIQWIDGKGELERQTADGKNLNGLHETFTDVIPYAPLFQQFLTLLIPKGLTLDQAKKVQCDLIDEIFNEKRQEPVHYPVAAGDYHWPGDDPNTAAMAVQVIPNIFAASSTGQGNADNLIAQLNTLVSQINAMIDQINGNQTNVVDQVNGTVVGGVNTIVVAQTNGNIVDGANSVIVARFNTLVNEINANIVAPANNAFSYINTMIGTLINEINSYLTGAINSYIVPSFNTLLYWCDVVLVGRIETSPGGTAGSNTLNNRLQPITTADGTFPSPGLISGAIAHTGIADLPGATGVSGESNPYATASVTTVAGTLSHIGTISGISYLAGLGHVGAITPPSPYTSGIPWTPIESTTPVNISIAEMSGIMQQVAIRRSTLLTAQTSKKNAVNALTTIAAVIAYDVTTGWPAPSPSSGLWEQPGLELEILQ